MKLEHWIEYPPEPRELILTWQAPAQIPDRLRWAVGRLRISNDVTVFDYFDADEFNLFNLRRSAQDLQSAGYAGYPAFDIKKRPRDGFRDHTLEAFLRRLPPAARSDFPDYLAYFRIRPTTSLSPLALLALTQARLPSDGFSLIDPLDPFVSRVDLVIEVAGFRHQARPSNLKLDDPLELQPEPLNEKDPQAIQLKAGGQVMGYVNRLQAPTLLGWLRTRAVRCWITRLNGRPEAPRAFAFLQVRPTAQSIAA